MSNIPDIKSILDVLRPVEDPELRKSLVELNMIRNVNIIDGQVKFTLVLTISDDAHHANIGNRKSRKNMTPLKNSFYPQFGKKTGLSHGVLFPGIPALNSRETGMPKIREFPGISRPGNPGRQH